MMIDIIGGHWIDKVCIWADSYWLFWRCCIYGPNYANLLDCCLSWRETMRFLEDCRQLVSYRCKRIRSALKTRFCYCNKYLNKTSDKSSYLEHPDYSDDSALLYSLTFILCSTTPSMLNCSSINLSLIIKRLLIT